MFVPDLDDHGFSDITLTNEDNRTTSYKELVANGFVLDGGHVHMDCVLDGPYTKPVTVTHLVGSSVVATVQTQATTGEFSVSVDLRRGRNTFRFAVDDDGDEADDLTVDVFCKSTLREWCDNLVKALILVIVVKTFVVQAFFIPTGSMEDTFFPGDYILVDKVSYLLAPPVREDIIVFQYPRNFTQDFIKRLVGLPGDVIEMRQKQFIRNGEPVKEPFIVNKDFRRYVIGPWAMRDNWGPLEVPDDAYYVLGDNRDYSQDSRFWGPLPKYRLKGRAFLIYYPFRRFGLIRHGRRSAPSVETDADL